jgi:transposase-like protein
MFASQYVTIWYMIRRKSTFQLAKEKREERKAVELYKKGYSTREVERMLKAMGITRSHMWVHRAIKKHIPQLST